MLRRFSLNLIQNGIMSPKLAVCGPQVFDMDGKSAKRFSSHGQGLHLIIGFRRPWIKMRSSQKLVAASLRQKHPR